MESSVGNGTFIDTEPPAWDSVPNHAVRIDPAIFRAKSDIWSEDYDVGHDQKISSPDEPDLPIIRREYPVLAQMIVGFAVGLMFSPWSTGIQFVLAFMIVYETLVYVITDGKEPYWNLADRAAIVACYLFGWIIGRYLAGWVDPFVDSPFSLEYATLTPAQRIGSANTQIYLGAQQEPLFRFQD